MYAHVHSNVHSHLKSVTTHSKTVADGILRDFENLQLSALNKASFRKVYGLMEQKYLGHYQISHQGHLKTHKRSKHKGVEYVCVRCEFQAILMGHK